MMKKSSPIMIMTCALYWWWLMPLLNAELTLLSPRQLEPFLISRTSLFKYYGKPRGQQSINASAIVLSGKDTCYPDGDVVKGKIVLAVRENRLCDLEESYERLSQRGAVAFVSISAMMHPGQFCYRHMSWNAQKFAHNPLVLVEATKNGFVNAGSASRNKVDREFRRIMDDWSAAAAEGSLQLLLAPPWDSTYQDWFESWWWTLVMRVLLPAYALYVCAFAALQSHQYYRRSAEWAPGRVICALETPIMLLIAVFLACGLYVSFIIPSSDSAIVLLVCLSIPGRSYFQNIHSLLRGPGLCRLISRNAVRCCTQVLATQLH